MWYVGRVPRPPTYTTSAASRRAIAAADRNQRANSALLVPVPRVPPRGKRWRPPEGLEPSEIRAIIDAATSDRDRLLLRCMWATGGRASEVLALRPMDVQRGGLVLPNRKNRDRADKFVALPGGGADLVAELLLYAQQNGIGPRDPLFASRVHGADGRRRPISKVQLWRIVKEASRRAGVYVLAMRPSADGDRGEPAPAHPHLFRHARVRQILKHTNGNLPLAMHAAGWSTLQVAYLKLTDSAAAELMEGVPE